MPESATTVHRNGSHTSEAQAAIAIVEKFIAALERLDVDEALSYTSPDLVYQNVPVPPTRTQAGARRVLNSFLKPSTGFEVRMHNIAANGPIVLTERTDIIKTRVGDFAFWVCGTFEVRDGKIVLWRDRFDFAHFTFATIKGIAVKLASLARTR